MKLFGTDGIRGKAGNAPLIPETVARVGAALVRAFRGDQGSGIGDQGSGHGSRGVRGIVLQRAWG